MLATLSSLLIWINFRSIKVIFWRWANNKKSNDLLCWTVCSTFLALCILLILKAYSSPSQFWRSFCFSTFQRLLARPGLPGIPGIPVCVFWKATSVFKLCFILGSTKYTATYICSRKTSELIFNRTLDQKLKQEAYFFFCLIMSHSTSNCCP